MRGGGRRGGRHGPVSRQLFRSMRHGAQWLMSVNRAHGLFWTPHSKPDDVCPYQSFVVHTVESCNRYQDAVDWFWEYRRFGVGCELRARKSSAVVRLSGFCTQE